jgi:hypothetical protein
LLEGISHTKLRQFAAETAALEPGELLDMSQQGKRHTLLLSLIRQARTRCRDELIEMLIRRVRRTQATAKERLAALQGENRELEEQLIGLFGRVLATAKAENADAAFWTSRSDSTDRARRHRPPHRAVRNRHRLARQQRSAAALANSCPDPRVPCLKCKTARRSKL